MPVTTIIEGIRNYIAACPVLNEIPSGNGHINHSADPDSVGNYGVFFADCSPVSLPYIDGSREMRYTVKIVLRRIADSDAKRLEQAAQLEQLQRWIAMQSDLPEMPEGCIPLKIDSPSAELCRPDSSGKKGCCSAKVVLTYTMEGTGGCPAYSVAAPYMNLGTAEEPVWSLCGRGWRKFAENPNPQTSSVKFLNAVTEVTDTLSYSPKYSFECDLTRSDPAIMKICGMAKERKACKGAVVDMLLADLSQTDGTGSCTARRMSLSVAVDLIDGIEKMLLSGTMNCMGGETLGRFAVEERIFTADENGL